ncbi:glutaredoxin family protein [Rothia koreensis]|uniref:glutaredoxin family protein n=1 Tax=Rothia koreensis TaxID=592378 RepID=UPI003F255C98
MTRETDFEQSISVELLTSPGCHLCADAKRDLDEVTGPLGLEWTEINVEDHLDLLKQHAEDIPVVRVNGVPRDFWRVDKPRLRRILQGMMAGRDPEEL